MHSAPGEPDLLYIDLHLVHEVTSPQAFDGLRMNGRTVRRPDLTIATEDHNVPTERHRPTDRGPDLAQADRGAAAQLRRVRHPPLRDGPARPGHRARDRSRAGPHAARHDRRVRRQPHVARTARSARSRSASARARSSTSSRRRRCRRPDRSGWRSPSTASCPRASTAKDVILAHHRADRHGRRHRLRHRVPRLGDPRAVDGRPDDGLQHVDRGRRAGRAHRAGRHHVRLPRGAPTRTHRQGVGATRSTTGARSSPTTVRGSMPRSPSTRRRSSPHVTWGTNPAQVIGIDGSVPDPSTFADPNERETAERALVYMGLEAGTPMRDDPRRHRVHRFVHEQPHRGPARRSGGGRRPARDA